MSSSLKYISYVAIPGFTYVSKTPLHIDKIVLSAKIGNQDIPIFPYLKYDADKKEFVGYENSKTPKTNSNPLTFSRCPKKETDQSTQFVDICTKKTDEGEYVYTHHISKHKKPETVRNEDNVAPGDVNSSEKNCFGFILLDDVWDIDITITFKLYSFIKETQNEQTEKSQINSGGIPTDGKTMYKTDNYSTVYLGDWVTIYNPAVKTRTPITFTIKEAEGIFNQYSFIDDEKVTTFTIPIAGWLNYENNSWNSVKPSQNNNILTFDNNITNNTGNINDFVNQDWLEKYSINNIVNPNEYYGLSQTLGTEMPNANHSTDDSSTASKMEVLAFIDGDGGKHGRQDVMAKIGNITSAGNAEQWAKSTSYFSKRLPYRLMGAYFRINEGHPELFRVAGTPTMAKAREDAGKYLPFLVLVSIQVKGQDSKIPTIKSKFYSSYQNINKDGWEYLYGHLPYIKVETTNQSAKLIYDLDKQSTAGFLTEAAGVTEPGEVEYPIGKESEKCKYFMPIDGKDKNIPLLSPHRLYTLIPESCHTNFNRLSTIPENTKNDKNKDSGLIDKLNDSGTKSTSQRAFLEVRENNQISYGVNTSKLQESNGYQPWSYAGSLVDIDQSDYSFTQCSRTANEFKNALVLQNKEITMVIDGDNIQGKRFSEIQVKGAPSVITAVTQNRGVQTSDYGWKFKQNNQFKLSFGCTTKVDASQMVFNNKSENTVVPYLYFSGFTGVNARLSSSVVRESNIIRQNYCDYNSLSWDNRPTRTFVQKYASIKCEQNVSITVKLTPPEKWENSSDNYFVIKITGVKFSSDKPGLIDFTVSNGQVVGTTFNGVTLMYATQEYFPTSLTITPQSNGYISSIGVFRLNSTKEFVSEITGKWTPSALTIMDMSVDSNKKDYLEKIIFPSIICAYESFSQFGAIQGIPVTLSDDDYIKRKYYQFAALPQQKEVIDTNDSTNTGDLYQPIIFYKITKESKLQQKDCVVMGNTNGLLPNIENWIVKNVNEKWTNITATNQGTNYFGETPDNITVKIEHIPEYVLNSFMVSDVFTGGDAAL